MTLTNTLTQIFTSKRGYLHPISPRSHERTSPVGVCLGWIDANSLKVYINPEPFFALLETPQKKALLKAWEASGEIITGQQRTVEKRIHGKKRRVLELSALTVEALDRLFLSTHHNDGEPTRDKIADTQTLVSVAVVSEVGTRTAELPESRGTSTRLIPTAGETGTHEALPPSPVGWSWQVQRTLEKVRGQASTAQILEIESLAAFCMLWNNPDDLYRLETLCGQFG